MPTSCSRRSASGRAHPSRLTSTSWSTSAANVCGPSVRQRNNPPTSRTRSSDGTQGGRTVGGRGLGRAPRGDARARRRVLQRGARGERGAGGGVRGGRGRSRDRDSGGAGGGA